MKKVVIISLVVVLVLSVSLIALANDNTPEWFKDMVEWRKAQIQEALDAGTITEEQAEFYQERMDQMEKYHGENGFQMPMMGGGRRFNGGKGGFNGMPGGCQGPGGWSNNQNINYQ